ncbi:type II toxin-antitoxin system RelE/ParE family toxin, partial [Desulfovibrio desulfuricans]|nr:type II toxin-antitoxin system RelE/ParE family toxin [Desulfovibrio desulfuricans]
LPRRGNVPPELEIVGITRYREIHVHPWRIIYKALEAVVHVHWVFDSRRDVAGQFAQKMLR